jgi:2-iminobutanoate/2-iminopropanoate deaminase
MPAWTRVNAPGLPTVPAFAHAAIAGDQIHVSGMLGVKEDLSGVVEGGVGAETRQALTYLERALAECGATLADVVKVNVFMTDLSGWDAMNEAYLEAFGEHTPARIAVGCASLLFGCSVELDCIAVREPG